MMKYAIIILFVLAIGPALITGCKPSGNNNLTGGGKGGNATMVVQADHANSLIDTAIAFIKYASKNAPENGQYDDSVKFDKNGHGIFANLTTGNYYLLVEGIHNPYNPNTVRGGRGWAITGNTAIDTVTCPTYQDSFTYPSWGW